MNGCAETTDRFEALYRARFDELVRVIRFQWRWSDAEDLAQEAFLRFFKAYAASWVDDPWAMLRRIARNLVVDAARHHALPLPDPEARNAPDAESLVGHRMALAAVTWAVHAEDVLDDDKREVLLRTANGDKRKTIARELGIDETRVANLRHRARMAIQRELEHHEQALRMLGEGATVPGIARQLGLQGRDAGWRLFARIHEARKVAS